MVSWSVTLCISAGILRYTELPIGSSTVVNYIVNCQDMWFFTGLQGHCYNVSEVK